MNNIATFLPWHYSKGLEIFIHSWLGYFDVIVHYFSLPLLLKTFFAPWKRMIDVQDGPGFDPQREFNKMMYNLVSRVIGAFVRFGLFITGLLLINITFIGGILGLLAWMIMPFISIPLYTRWLKDPTRYAKELVNKMFQSGDALATFVQSDAGRELVKHLGVSSEVLMENATHKLDIRNVEVNNFEELVSHILSQNIWPGSFYRKFKLEEKDMLFVASNWDKKRAWESYIGFGEFGAPSVGLELLFGYTPTLNRYSNDLSSPREYSHHLIGREEIVSRMERILGSGNSVLLLGEPGVGKRTVILEFAHRARSGQLGQKMAYRRVLEFDHNSLLSGSIDMYQKKAELNRVLTEAAYAGNVILAIKDFHRLVSASAEGYDFTDVFDNLLHQRDLKLIVMSTVDEYERFISHNMRIRKYLDVVKVEEPTKEVALQILFESAMQWEKNKEIIVTVPALRKILEDSDRYITETPFPEKALEILDSVVAYVQQEGSSLVVTDEDVAHVLSEKTGISFGKLTGEEEKQLVHLEDTIHQSLINQDVAVSLIAKSLRARTVGPTDQDRPLGSFLFLGPTGVGKTETAKVLADVYFGSKDTILRFDMAEYAGKEGFERLIGSLDSNRPGTLTSAIKNRPASLLLLDEFEKATPQIYNLFLRLLDEGKMTDAFGKTVLGSHLFVIATSNAGAEYIRELTQKRIYGEELQKKVTDYVLKKGIYSPEFLNRFDAVVVFEPLKHKDLLLIAYKLLEKLAHNLKQKNIYLEITDDVCQKIVQDGYDPAFGARPMNRLVNLILGDLFGRAILDGYLKEDDRVMLIPTDVKDNFQLKVIGKK